MADTANTTASKPEIGAEVKTVLNIRNVTTIPNSISEFNIYTYKAEIDTTTNIKRPGFFNPGYSIFEVGDVIRVFQLEKDKTLSKYYEFMVMKVDKTIKEVVVTILNEKNLEKNIIS